MTEKTKNTPTIRIVRAAAVAALYTALVLIFGFSSWGPFNFRIAEALTILPLLFPEAVAGLAIGCLLSNLIGPYGIYDVLFGTLATLLAAYMTYKLKKIQWGVLPPILLNALAVPAILLLSGEEGAYWVFALSVLLGQTAAVAGFGIPLYFSVKKIYVVKAVGKTFL